MQKRKWSDRFSEEYIRKRLTSIFHQVREERSLSPIEAGVKQLVSEYESFDEEYFVIVPLVGISIGETPARLGRVTLRRYDPSTSEEVTERCRTIIMSNPKYPSERKEAYFKGKDDRYLSKLRGNVCSEIVVKAEPSRAMEIALEETRKALDLLRYGILFLFTKERPRAVGVLGEVTEQSRVAIAIRTDNKEANITEERTNFPLELTDETLKRMKDIGIFDLSDVITKKDKTEFEEIILRAVHWLASAQAQNENENTLLNLVTCLETFFKAEAGTPITATISEGVALLTATEVEARKERKRRVADFYGKRSKLTHEGEGLITNADLLELTMIARDLTLWMIRNRSKFRDHESFKGWLEDQKMSAEVRLPS